ncbi:MAG: hypothetical protein EOO68_15645, partial [Moraxellaceae bacterium]
MSNIDLENNGAHSNPGVPDLNAMTQLANELFRALPGASDIFTNNLASQIPANLPQPSLGSFVPSVSNLTSASQDLRPPVT